MIVCEHFTLLHQNSAVHFFFYYNDIRTPVVHDNLYTPLCGVIPRAFAMSLNDGPTVPPLAAGLGLKRTDYAFSLLCAAPRYTGKTVGLTVTTTFGGSVSDRPPHGSTHCVIGFFSFFFLIIVCRRSTLVY